MKYYLINIFLLCLVIPFFSILVSAAETFVDFKSGDLSIYDGTTFGICIDDNDFEGVKIAANNLKGDFLKVTGKEPTVNNLLDKSTKIIVGTLGKSSIINELSKQNKIKGALLKGKNEKYLIQIIDKKLVIAGSDKRGTIYGIYELSKQIGISPWYYWADVPAETHNRIYIKRGIYTDGEPKVHYRGLFLNDEAPCLSGWSRTTFGGFNHKFYEKVFELILRLKGNFMWPAMWSNAFYTDDEENSQLADKMGIIIGTSHHEPMGRSQKEWKTPTMGQWNYSTNADKLKEFWAGGCKRNMNTEDVLTVGMRGDGDMPMSNGTNITLQQQIVNDQRKIIEEQKRKKASEVPQVWALYKEVQNYYNEGMKVPDDITLLLCDNNWGSIRLLPDLNAAPRKGGYGIYYHYDYVGGPRSYRWLNVSQIQRVWSDMNMAYENGVDKLWIVNVGDLKPMEYPIQFWFDMAWNPTKFNPSNLYQHTIDFCEEQFGKDNAKEAARILNMYCKYAHRITAELLNGNTYSLNNYNEFKRVRDDYKVLEADANKQYKTLDDKYKNAYMEIILYPVEAYSNIYDMYYAVACKDSDKVKELFNRDAELSKFYNDTLAGGKWKHMMDQTHIGYFSWDAPRFNRMPSIATNNNNNTGIINDKNNDNNAVVSIEAEHFYDCQADTDLKWNVIPYFGKTLSGVTLLPTNKEIKNSSLVYKFKTEKISQKAKLHCLIAPMLDYTGGKGIFYEVSIDNGTPVKVNLLGNRKDIPEGFYEQNRIIDSSTDFEIENTANNVHTITFKPISRGIILEKVILDLGGMKASYLGTPETNYIKKK